MNTTAIVGLSISLALNALLWLFLACIGYVFEFEGGARIALSFAFLSFLIAIFFFFCKGVPT